MEQVSPSSYIEKHNLSDSNDVVNFMFGKNVVLHVTSETNGVRQRDSTRAHSQILTDYKWENKGGSTDRILAIRDKLIAYRLFNENTGEAVRVLERETRARHLIKDFRHPIVDIQWATHAPFLAVLDGNSNIYVYHVADNCSLSKYLNIIREESCSGYSTPILAWCPYIPEDEADSNKDVHLLAVANGDCVDIFSLHSIKESLNRSEVVYEQAVTVPGGVLSVKLESEVQSVKLSPDATAMALSTADGYVSFYVIDTDRTRFANRVRPIPNNYAEEIAFLDNLSERNQDQFWKFVVLSADSGRRLTIYDCDNWTCLGKLRFESSNQINRLEFFIDQTAHFIFMVDYDSSCLYCLELNYIASKPNFSSCTRVAFFNIFVSIAPCNIAENTECELSLDESDTKNTIIATFVAITSRSLIEMNINLERHQLEPSAFIPSSRPGILSAETGDTAALLMTTQSNDLTMPILQNATSSGNGAANISSEAQAEKTKLGFDFTKTDVYVPAKARAKSVNTSIGCSAKDLATVIASAMDAKLTPLHEKIDVLQANVEKLQMENQTLRDVHTDNLSNALEKISNEFKAQSGHVETLINDSASASREQIVAVVEASLSAATLNLQSVADLSKSEILGTVSSTVQQMLLPTVESLCSQLFEQMNENFRRGLQEFMDQLAQFQRESSLYFMKRTL